MVLVIKENKKKEANAQETLLYKFDLDKMIIRLKTPLNTFLIHTFTIVCTIAFILLYGETNKWFILVFIGLLLTYNIYKLVELFLRKMVINLSNHEIIFYTPLKRKTKIDMIENVFTQVIEDPEGSDRYFVYFQVRDKKNWFKIETVSEEQANAIKSLLKYKHS